MKIYNTQVEIDADLDEAGNINIQDGIDIRCDCTIKGDITAWDISAGNISAGDISAWDISARNISAWDISARNISAWDIFAWNITAGNISARDICYYAVCVAYQTFTCRAVKGRREKSLHACLDSAIIFKKGGAT